MSTSPSQRSTFDVRPPCTLVEDLYWTGCWQIDSRGLSRDAHLTDLRRGLAQLDCHSLVCWSIRTGRARGKSTVTIFWVEHTKGCLSSVIELVPSGGKNSRKKKTSEAVPSFLRIIFPCSDIYDRQMDASGGALMLQLSMLLGSILVELKPRGRPDPPAKVKLYCRSTEKMKRPLYTVGDAEREKHSEVPRKRRQINTLAAPK